MKAYRVNCKYVRRVSELRNLRDVQKSCIYDGYTLGMYNSLEIALSLMEAREPLLLGYADIKKKGSENDENKLEDQIKEQDALGYGVPDDNCFCVSGISCVQCGTKDIRECCTRISNDVD